jgi:hypothetical protein
MKSCRIVLLLFFLFVLSCTSSDETNESPVNSSPLLLSENRQETGAIENVGDIDWYRYRTRQSNALLYIQCTNNTRRPDADLLVTVYNKDTDGKFNRLYADHAPENSVLPTNIQINLLVEDHDDIFISVRDYKDDESSEFPYYIKVSESEMVSSSTRFDLATPITIDDPEGCINASIESIGNVDNYRFSISARGVYEIDISPQSFQNTTSVVFSVDIYTASGILLSRHRPFHNYSACLSLLLDSGDYRIVVSDSGQDDADPSASCRICIQSRSETELSVNDHTSTATQLGDFSSGMIHISGRLAYVNDQDCYSVDLSQFSNQQLSVIQLQFMSISNDQGTYQLDYYDTNQLILSHEYTKGIHAYETFMNVHTNNNIFCVHPVITDNCNPMAYTAQLALSWVDDPDELIEKQDQFTGQWIQGNNTISASSMVDVTELTSTCSGKIAYQGDEDWYELSVNHQEANILNIFFETQTPGDVEYKLSIIEDSIVTRRLNMQSSEIPAFLKTGIFVPSSDSPTTKSYFFRISDDLGNDADPDTTYTFSAFTTPIPSFIAPFESPLTTIYHHENLETGSHIVSLTLYDKTTKSFHVDTNSFSIPQPSVVTSVEMDNIRIQFPWIGGYIDYQGDQDWFYMYLDQLNTDALGLDESFSNIRWYYDIEITFISLGSSVEYVWKFFRDKTGNKKLNDTQNTTNGFFASAGDTDIEISAMNIQTPSNDQKFWVGDQWKGNFYICITDFNNITGSEPDDDWGYDAPYYIQVTLVYHPGISSPE